MTVEAKHAAAEAAGAANDAAAALAGAASLVGLVSWYTGVGAGVAAVLAGASAAAWWVGNEYGDLALDPPRPDYHLVKRFQPRAIRAPMAESENAAIWGAFLDLQIEMGDAIAALVTSMERLDGARMDLKRPGADADRLTRQMGTQRRAIRHNATAATRRVAQLLALRSRVNEVWRRDLAAFEDRHVVVTAEGRLQATAALWQTILPTLQHSFGGGERLLRIKDVIEQAAAKNIMPGDEVLDARWAKAMALVGKRLAVLAGERREPPKRHELDRRL
jgi:hypothetical protein